MQLARRRAEQALRLEIVVIAVEAQQIVQDEGRLRPLYQLAVGTARRQVGIAIRRIGRHLIKKNIDGRILGRGVVFDADTPATDWTPGIGMELWSAPRER